MTRFYDRKLDRVLLVLDAESWEEVHIDLFNLTHEKIKELSKKEGIIGTLVKENEQAFVSTISGGCMDKIHPDGELYYFFGGGYLSSFPFSDGIRFVGLNDLGKKRKIQKDEIASFNKTYKSGAKISVEIRNKGEIIPLPHNLMGE